MVLRVSSDLLHLTTRLRQDFCLPLVWLLQPISQIWHLIRSCSLSLAMGKGSLQKSRHSDIQAAVSLTLDSSGMWEIPGRSSPI